jgi:pyridoxal phosphate enzyme (YggS family)
MTIAFHLGKVLQRIADSVNKYRESDTQIRLVAVSKTKPAEDVLAAHREGQRDFGENYVQEAIAKIQQLYDQDLCWHYIGPIQSNKTAKIAEHFDWCQSVDRLKIAKRLSSQRPQGMPPLNVCIQVNISGEESKSGITISEIDDLAAAINELPNLTLRGLMAIPMKTKDESEQRQAFAKLRSAFNTLQDAYPQVDTLSMGMSGDMEAAIAEGSTMVRVGTDIFGARQ